MIRVRQGDTVELTLHNAERFCLPAGNAGSFSVPVRMAILRKSNNEPGVTKLYRASVTLPFGQTEGEFTVISEPLRVPFI
jgi:FtsP/CotA-like multicopper oxidase with cupredoxin domain